MTIVHTLGVNLVILDPAIKAEYARENDAGFDLRARIEHSISIPAGRKLLIPTGIKVGMPVGYVGLVCSRSGLASKHGVAVANAPGVIDCGYTGEIGVILENRGQQTYIVQPYDRIAQFVIAPVYHAVFNIVDSLDETERGENGFGSTGVA